MRNIIFLGLLLLTLVSCNNDNSTNPQVYEYDGTWDIYVSKSSWGDCQFTVVKNKITEVTVTAYYTSRTYGDKIITDKFIPEKTISNSKVKFTNLRNNRGSTLSMYAEFDNENKASGSFSYIFSLNGGNMWSGSWSAKKK